MDHENTSFWGIFLRVWNRVRSAVVDSIKLFQESDGFRYSAATSYFALLSFVPFLIVTLSVLGFVLVAAGSKYQSQTEFLDAIMVTAERILPFMKESLKEQLRLIMVTRQTTGLVGGVALIFASSMFFGSLEHALRRLYHQAKPRPMFLSKLLYLGFVGALGLFIVTIHYLISFVSGFIVAEGGQSLYELAYSSPWVEIPLSFLGTVMVFIVLVRVFSTVKFRNRYLLVGGTVFFLTWRLARFAFALYLGTISQFSVTYGSLGAIMALIFWVFYSISIFLFCAALVKVLHGEEYFEPEPEPDSGNLTKRFRKMQRRWKKG